MLLVGLLELLLFLVVIVRVFIIINLCLLVLRLVAFQCGRFSIVV